MQSLSDYIYKGPEIELVTGRTINLQCLNQSLTYAHVLEGIPYGPDFADTVSLHYKWAQDSYPNRKIIVLEPRLRPLTIIECHLEKLTQNWERAKQIASKSNNGDAFTREDFRYSGWPEPVCIGSVCCQALFESTPIDKEAGMLSELFVVWFQDGFAMPVDPYVIEQLKSIDWDNQAEDTDL